MTVRGWSPVAAILVLLVASATRLEAQGVCDISRRADSPTDESWGSPLDRRITLLIADISLRDALDRVGAEARLKLSYSRELLPLDRRVCLDHRRAPVGRVLDELLAGTELAPVALGGDQVVITRRTPAPDSVTSIRDSATHVQQLVPVVVTANQPETLAGRDGSASVTVIDGADLASAELRTLAQVLERYAPGAGGWSAGGSALATRHAGMRGASSFGTSAPKIYIDGIELANPSVATVLGSEVIERIEIIRGPQGAALYGSDALNGVVSITMRHDGAEGPGVDLGVRSAAGLVESQYASSASFAQSHLLSLRAGSVPRSFSLTVTGDESGAYLPGAGSREASAVATARLAGPRASLGMTGRLAGVTARSPFDAVSPLGAPSDLAASALASESLTQYTFGVSASLVPNDGWRHSLVAGVDGYRLSAGRDRSPAGVAATDRLIDALPVSAVRASFRAASVGRIAMSNASSATLTVAGEHTALREASIVPAASDASGESSRSSTGVLSHLELSFHDAFFVNGGLRVERTGIRDESVPIIAALPIVGAAAVLDRGPFALKLRSAYGKGIRTPRAPSIERVSRRGYAQIRSATLMPEQQAGFELGVDLFAGRAFSLEVTHFDQIASGLQQRVAFPLRNGDVLYHYQSVGEISNRGWEMRPELSLGRLSIGGALSLIDSRVMTVAPQYDGDLRPGDRMLGVPALTAALSIAYDTPRLSASIGLSQASDWVGYDVLALARASAASDSAPASLRGFWREYSGATQLRASLSRDLGRGLSFVLTGENLLDQPWGALDNGTPVPGRTTTAGLRARF